MKRGWYPVHKRRSGTDPCDDWLVADGNGGWAREEGD